MSKNTVMLEVGAVKARARTAFDRNWRKWARELFMGDAVEPTLSINVHPPRESDLTTGGQVEKAREWVARWRACPLPGVEWQQRRWARVGDQSVPVRARLENAADIALWGERDELWSIAIERIGDVRALVEGADPKTMALAAEAVRTSISGWCALDLAEWDTSLHVWEWLLGHPRKFLYARQLPIRGIDTKWIEKHEKTLRGLHRAIAGIDYAFAQPAKLFRCKACSKDTELGGCDEFALPAGQLAAMRPFPRAVVICENLVNTLCLHDLPGTLAIHGSGFAVNELQAVPWLSETPLLYWGDLDSNGFAILNMLRSFAPHARSIMMDASTLNSYFDLCVEEPQPATSAFEHLSPAERNALLLLSQGDPTRGIANLRLEQERIEWGWAYERIAAELAK